MSTKSRQTIYGDAIIGVDIRAKSAREVARKAAREADRAEAEAWSIRMEGYGGPAQPSPTIGQCLNGGLSWIEIECNRCKTRASIPLDAIRRPRNTPIWKLEGSVETDTARPVNDDLALIATSKTTIRTSTTASRVMRIAHVCWFPRPSEKRGSPRLCCDAKRTSSSR
jgi:hypothetical protein